MSKVKLLFGCVALLMAQPALAQIALCTGSPLPGGYISFSPPTPTANQSVAITVGRNAYVPVAISATVQGNTIDVTLTATFNSLGIPPPVACDTVVVGPLSSGTYTANFLVLDLTHSNTTFLAQTASLLVTSGASAIPAASHSILAALIALLVISAWHHIRHRGLTTRSTGPAGTGFLLGERRWRRAG